MALEEPNSSSMPPSPDEELVGTIFADRYELLSIICKGGWVRSISPSISS